MVGRAACAWGKPNRIWDGHARAIFTGSGFVRHADQSPHHLRPHCRQSEFRSLLLRKIENALAKLFKYAAVMCEAFHRASSKH